MLLQENLLGGSFFFRLVAGLEFLTAFLSKIDSPLSFHGICDFFSNNVTGYHSLSCNFTENEVLDSIGDLHCVNGNIYIWISLPMSMPLPKFSNGTVKVFLFPIAA